MNNCGSQPGVSNITECVDNNVGEISISCAAGELIHIYNSGYGRAESNIYCCGDPGNCAACGWLDTTRYVKTACDGEETCSIQHNDNVIDITDLGTAGCPLMGGNFYQTYTYQCYNPTVQSDCINTEGSYKCICPLGFILDEVTNTCEDIDECVDIVYDNCHVNQTCLNTLGSYICTGGLNNETVCPDCPGCGENAHCIVNLENQLPECECLDGYDGNPDILCIDINECQNVTLHGCDNVTEYCINTDGSFACACENGYSRNFLTDECDDVNECLLDIWHNCEAKEFCHNTNGSFFCESNCTEVIIEELDCPNCGLNEICTVANTTGQPALECICKTGFELNFGVCEDIDECKNMTNVEFCESQNPPRKCVNAQGTFACDCAAGYQTALNGDCEDVDECSPNGFHEHNCFINETCINTIGSYHCEFNETYCPQCLHGCGDNSICVIENLIAECECLPGYSGNATDGCIDIDECDDSNLHGCSGFQVR